MQTIQQQEITLILSSVQQLFSGNYYDNKLKHEDLTEKQVNKFHK